MDFIYLNGQELFLNSKFRSYVYVEELVGVFLGCFLMVMEDCVSSFCQNGGICSLLFVGGYYCKCSVLYIGMYCEISVNLCFFNLCFYGGICVVDNGGFVCQCRGLYIGQRCQFSLYCKDDFCKNGGICFDSLDGVVCQCDLGFRGERCQSDIDECVGNLCWYGVFCENIYGFYYCNCSYEYRGCYCEDVVFNQYVFMLWNIGLVEGIGIIVFIVGIFLLVVVFVFCCKMISWKKKYQVEFEDKYLGFIIVFLQRFYFDFKLNKNIYLDVLFQVFVWFIFYILSILSDFRNNFD